MSTVDLSELAPFFDAIWNAPDDDAPRLALADHLEARGDLRGRHVRLACQLARLERDDPARTPLQRELETLPSFSFFQHPPPPFSSYSVGRGFVETISCKPEQLAAHSEEILRAAPIRILDIFSQSSAYGHLVAGATGLRHLRRIKLPMMTLDDFTAIVTSPNLANLEVLVLDTLHGPDRLAVLARPGTLPRLSTLQLQYGTVDDAEARALLSLMELRPSIAILDVTHTRLETRLDLRAKLGTRYLPHPPLPYAERVRFGRLDLSNAQLDEHALEAILATGPRSDVHTLDLPYVSIGVDGLERLAKSGAFPALRSLRVGAYGVGERGLELLATQATHLDELEELVLGEAEISEGTIRSLACSPRLPAIARIRTSKKWNVYADGARDDTETRKLTRSDGRTVLHEISHYLWP